MTFEVDDEPGLPVEWERRRALDEKAIAGIKSGEYSSPFNAADILASEYEPEDWNNRTALQQENYVKSLAKKYRRKLKK